MPVPATSLTEIAPRFLIGLAMRWTRHRLPGPIRATGVYVRRVQIRQTNQRAHDMQGVYENVYIGAFILTLGHRMGRDLPDAYPLASVNLYQQTPADALWGDLLADLSGLSCLLEFKRDATQIDSERKKKKALDLREAIIDNGVRELSVRCHFVGHASQVQEHRFTLCFQPYLAIWDTETEAIQLGPTVEMNKFLQRLLAGQIGLEASQFSEYIDILSGPGGGGGTPCLLVNFHEKEGIRLFVVPEVRLLRDTRRKLREDADRTVTDTPELRQPPEKERRLRLH